MTLKVLMLGWEFPPHSYGGLGVACYGLVRELTSQGVTISLILPKHQTSSLPHCTIYSARDTSLSIRSIASTLRPYQTSGEYALAYRDQLHGHLYGATLFEEVERYAAAILETGAHEDFDIIHAHDWMTFKAAQRLQAFSKKPLVVHIHATEFDRTGGGDVNAWVHARENDGMRSADRIIAVSDYTKKIIIGQYGIEPEKIEVVHNGIDEDEIIHDAPMQPHNHLVVFVGRLTLQKGPDYFIEAAKKILALRQDITFVLAGSGDMQGRLMDEVARSGYADQIIFTGFLPRPEVQRLLARADVYVMPSVSEPFGLTLFEALQQNTPVIVDRRAGVCELLSHCLKIDFWNIHELVDKILAVLDYESLSDELVKNGQQQLYRFTWREAAVKCIKVYKELLMRHA